MNRAMNGLISQSAAIATMALVTLFPTPEHFWSAMRSQINDPASRGFEISATPVSVLHRPDPKFAVPSVSRSDSSLTGYCLAGNPEEPVFFETCAWELHNIVKSESNTPQDASPITPSLTNPIEEIEARLGVSCRAEWSRSVTPETVLSSPPCDSLFRGIAENG